MAARRAWVAALVAAAGLVAATAVIAENGSGGARPPRRDWGIALPTGPNLAAVRTLARQVGRRPQRVMWYVAWSKRTDFPADRAAELAAAGFTPEVTWEPWNSARGVHQPTYALSRITGGSFDTYIRRWANEMRAYRRPVLLRFAHEMNGTWYPWAEGVNGNGPGSYVAAWRHVHAIFDAAHADNVRWVWCPNVPIPGSTPLANVFPGDASVDEVALDGYNKSTLLPDTVWQTPDQVFAAGLAQLRALSTRPIAIAEVGCAAFGGDKAAWIVAFWRMLAVHHEVRTVIWFDFDKVEFGKRPDWRINSSPSSAKAFTAGLGGYLAG